MINNWKKYKASNLFFQNLQAQLFAYLKERIKSDLKIHLKNEFLSKTDKKLPLSKTLHFSEKNIKL